MAIPDKILRKAGPLDDAEKVIMRTYCEIGYNMLTRIPFLPEAAEIVLAHQEFFDGTGYPRGLRGEQIPLGPRIISIANALDAILSDRRIAMRFLCLTRAKRFAVVPAHNSIPKLWRCFSPFPKTTGSSCVKTSAHPSA
jgi:HD domain